MDKLSASIDTIAKTCIAVRLRSLNRVVTNLYDDALRPLGLKISQMNILVVAAKLGVARPTQVCDLLQLDVSTLSRNLERMRAQGWLEVVPGEDARTQSFRLTTPANACSKRRFLPGKTPSSRPRKCWGPKASPLICQDRPKEPRQEDAAASKPESLIRAYFFRTLVAYTTIGAAMKLNEHPTVRHFHEKCQDRPVAPSVLDAAWLRQLCLDCGADDAGLVEIGRPALDDQREDVLRYFPPPRRCLVSSAG